MKSAQIYSMSNLQPSQKPQFTQGGFTLVELMVSLILGLILISGVLSIFNSNRENFKVTENLARIQENTRVAFDLMSRDLREAGETPCGSKFVANLLRSGGNIPIWSDWNSGAIRGFSGTTDVTDIAAFGTTVNSRVSNTDAVLVIQAAEGDTNIISHDTASFEIGVNSVTAFGADDIVIACDLQSAVIFQIGTVSTSTKTISYDASFTTLNCGNGLGYPTPVGCGTTPTKTFDTSNAQLASLKSSLWYIGVGSNGKNSLYRTRISRRTVGGAVQIITDRDEILPNIKDMKIQYLTKDLSTDTLNATWINANNTIYDSANGGWTDTNNNQTVAIRFEITLQSEDAVGVSNSTIEKKLIYAVGLRSRDTLFQVAP